MKKLRRMAMFGVMITLIVAAFAVLSINANAKSTPNNVWIDDDFDSSTAGWGVTRFCKIQDGVDAVDSGGKVHVFAGIYYENVVIGKSLKLMGQNQDTTIIQGIGSGYGVYSNGISDITIVNFQINDFYHGIYLVSSGSSKVYKNTITDSNRHGIYLSDSGSSTVTKNTVTNNNYHGIYLVSSGSSKVNENTLKNNGFTGIYLYYSSESKVNKNIISGSAYNGIYIHYSVSSKVNENTVTDITYTGIYVHYSGSSKVTENTVTDINDGIRMGDSGSSTVKGNIVTYSNNIGIHLVSSGSNKVTDNTIKENSYGFRLDSSFSNSIHYNNIIDNSYQLAGSGPQYTLNTWDDGAGIGNYWSDYEGEDTNNDGIGDTDLPHQGVDYYPVMTPM